MNIPLAHTIASGVNYGVKDTTNTYTLTQTISEIKHASQNGVGAAKKGEESSPTHPYTLSVTGTSVVKDTGKVLKNEKVFPEKALYFLNGKKVSRGDLNKDLQPEDIFSISVFKGPQAVSKFGQDAKDGAIQIYTKEFVKDHPGIDDIKAYKNNK
jgi:hypothetical protein